MNERLSQLSTGLVLLVDQYDTLRLDIAMDDIWRNRNTLKVAALGWISVKRNVHELAVGTAQGVHEQHNPMDAMTPVEFAKLVLRQTNIA